IGQRGRVGLEAALCLASLRAADPEFCAPVYIAEPQNCDLWTEDPRMAPELRCCLQDMGAQILPFTAQTFGQAYPHGNKIEALAAMPQGPALFLDSDTLITGRLSQFAFPEHASAAPAPSPSWPSPSLYGPTRQQIWAALFAQAGLCAETGNGGPNGRAIYGSAAWVYAPDAPQFGEIWRRMATQIWQSPPPELAGQALTPWLDQIALPLALAAEKGGLYHGAPLPILHYRWLPLLYATASEAQLAALRQIAEQKPLKHLLKADPVFRRFMYQKAGARARALFDPARLPRSEMAIRKRLRRAGLWQRSI
ncbi:MAG: hypothetical protein ACPGVJ_12090, partial [Mangrovicoccus sp.]